MLNPNRIFLVIGFIVLVLLCCLLRRCNLETEKRQCQWPLPLLALVFSVYLVVTFSGWVSNLQTLYEFACEHVPVLSEVNMTYFVTVLFNAFALLAFAAIKAVVLQLLKRIESNAADFWSIFYRFAYRYEEQDSLWFLRLRYAEIRRSVKWVYVASIVISLALLAWACANNNTGAFVNPFYPAFIVIIVGELYFFLDGMTQQEYYDKHLVEDDESARVRNYFALQQAAAVQFPDRFLESHIKGIRQDELATGRDMLKRFIESKDPEERLAGTYALAVHDAMQEFFAGASEEGDRSLLEANEFSEAFYVAVEQVETAVKLLKGKNIIFSTPFFIDYREFLFFPVNRVLMRGKNVLVIDGQHSSRSTIQSWISDGLLAASGMPGLWRIGDLEKDDFRKLEVGIFSFPLLNDLGFLVRISGFLERVGFVVLLNPSGMLGTTQVGLSRLTDLLPSSEKVTYVAFDVNADGLVDTLSHAVRAPFTEVSATSGMSLITCGLLWDADGEDLHTRIFENVSQYLGVGTEVSAFSLRQGMEKVVWSGGQAVPLQDVRWLAGQYYRAIGQYASLPMAQSSLDEAIEFNGDLWDVERVKDGYYVVEDEYANVLEIQRQYATRAMESSFVNVISGNYLLRDFMRYNEHLLFSDPKALSLVVADYDRSERNFLIELVAQVLTTERVSLVWVCARLRILGIDLPQKDAYEYITQRIEYFELLGSMELEDGSRVPFPASKLIDAPQVGRMFDPDKMAYVDYLYLTLRRTLDDDMAFEIASRLDYLKNSHYIAEDEVEDERYLGSCLYGQIQQRYLPGQFVTISGKYYEVLSITPDSGMLMRRAADHFDNRLYYRQVKKISLLGLEGAHWRDRALASGAGRVTISEADADVHVETLGYWRMTSYDDLENAVFVERTKGESGYEPRSYKNKRVARIILKNANDRQLITLTVLLGELFRTLYAKEYPYVLVVPKLGEPTGDMGPDGLSGVVPALNPCCYDGTDEPCLYLFEDSMIDMGLISSVMRNIERFLGLAYTYLAWHKGMLAEGPNLDPKHEHYTNPFHVLGVPVRKGAEPEPEPGFGPEDEPDPVPESSSQCDFCGRVVPASTMEKLRDGRERCQVCSRNAIKDKSEVLGLFRNVMRQMQLWFGVTFENPVSVKVVSAWRLHRSRGKKFVPTSRYDARCIGYVIVRRGRQEMWLENGHPRNSFTTTIAHELTHVWQHQIDYYLELPAHVDANERLEIVEGMASWVEVQFLLFAGEPEEAKIARDSLMRRDDEYGRGYRRYLKKYPHAFAGGTLKRNPFDYTEGPLAIDDYKAPEGDGDVPEDVPGAAPDDAPDGGLGAGGAEGPDMGSMGSDNPDGGSDAGPDGPDGGSGSGSDVPQAGAGSEEDPGCGGQDVPEVEIDVEDDDDDQVASEKNSPGDGGEV